MQFVRTTDKTTVTLICSTMVRSDPQVSLHANFLQPKDKALLSVMAKKFINDPVDVVEEMVKGVCLVHSSTLIQVTDRSNDDLKSLELFDGNRVSYIYLSCGAAS